MQSSDWKIIRTIFVVLSLSFLAGGVIIWLNVEGYGGFRGLGSFYEFRGYIVPLFIAGTSFLGIAIALDHKIAAAVTLDAKQLPKLESSSMQSRKYCINCGTKIPPNVKFCPNCGQDLQ